MALTVLALNLSTLYPVFPLLPLVPGAGAGGGRALSSGALRAAEESASALGQKVLGVSTNVVALRPLPAAGNTPCAQLHPAWHYLLPPEKALPSPPVYAFSQQTHGEHRQVPGIHRCIGPFCLLSLSLPFPGVPQGPA